MKTAKIDYGIGNSPNIVLADYSVDSVGETLMMIDRLLKSTPDGKLTVFKSGLFGGQNVSVFISYCGEQIYFWLSYVLT